MTPSERAARKAGFDDYEPAQPDFRLWRGVRNALLVVAGGYAIAAIIVAWVVMP